MKLFFRAKKVPAFWVIFLIPIFLLSQNTSKDKYTILLDNWEGFHKRSQFDEAFQQAEEAFTLAESKGPT